MRVTGWRLAAPEPSAADDTPAEVAVADEAAAGDLLVPGAEGSNGAAASAPDGLPDGGLVELDERAGPLVLSALYGCATPNGHPRAASNSTAWTDGEVAVVVGGDTRVVRPGEPVAPRAPADLLVVDIARPVADWSRLVDPPVAPDDPLAALDAAIESLLEGAGDVPSVAALRDELAELDRCLADPHRNPIAPVDRCGEAEGRHAAEKTDTAHGSSGEQRLGQADHRPVDESARWTARQAEEAEEHGRMAAECAAERDLLEAELAAAAAEATPAEATPAEATPAEATPAEATPAEATPGAGVPTAEARTTPTEPPATTPPSGAPAAEAPGTTPASGAPAPQAHLPPTTQALISDALAIRELGRSLSALEQARTEATAAANTATVLRRALEGCPDRGRRSGPRVQAALLALAVVLVVLAVVLITRGASGAGIALAVAAAVAAGIALALPHRARGTSPPSDPSRSPEALRRRLALADDERRARNAECSMQSARVAELARPLGLDQLPTAAAVAARRQQLETAFEARRRLDEETRRRPSDHDERQAEEDSRQYLLARRALLEARSEAEARSWATWRDERHLPRWWTADDAAAYYRGEAAALADDTLGLVELRQRRQGVLDQLGRLSRELDRLVLARWLLTRAAEATTATTPEGTAAERTAATGLPPERGRGASPSVATPLRRPSEPARLRERTAELLSLASGGRVVGLRVELPAQPVLLLAGGGELVLGADRDARMLVDLCAVLATGELAAGPERWPIVVTGLEAWPVGEGRQIVRQLLDDVAGRTQVLVVSPSASSGGDRVPTTAPADATTPADDDAG